MRYLIFGSTLMAALAIMCRAPVAQAAVFVPPGLTPGSTYHLVFATRDTRDGSSTNIADYNSFVNAQAALNPALTGTSMGIQYFASASTPTVHANVNAAVNATVYNFSGIKVADDFTDMWDGTLDSAIAVDQFANTGFPDIWTGTDSAGLRITGNELGTTNPGTGLTFSSTATWIDDAVAPSATQMALYGLSQELTVPGVPEPATAMLLLLGSCILLIAGRARR